MQSLDSQTSSFQMPVMGLNGLDSPSPEASNGYHGSNSIGKTDRGAPSGDGDKGPVGFVGQGIPQLVPGTSAQLLVIIAPKDSISVVQILKLGCLSDPNGKGEIPARFDGQETYQNAIINNLELEVPKAPNGNVQIETNFETRVCTGPIGGKEAPARFDGKDATQNAISNEMKLGGTKPPKS